MNPRDLRKPAGTASTTGVASIPTTAGASLNKVGLKRVGSNPKLGAADDKKDKGKDKKQPSKGKKGKQEEKEEHEEVIKSRVTCVDY
jgi:hypothetical protein